MQSFSTSSTVDPLRPHQEEEEEHDTFDPFSLDPQLRLRTVRTAHSVIAESIRSERDADARKRKRRIFSGLRRRGTMSTLGTVKDSLRRKGSDSEGLSRPASSEHLTEHGTPKRRRSEALSDSTPPAPDDKGKGKAKVAARRTLYVNVPLPTQLLTAKGDPIIRYVRNKVRTSKYTIVSFIPKNLFEQFRRAANIYFLALVIIQLFSIFGAPNAQIGMLPLIAILGMTAIKDGIEDWRRARLDNEVNNSAATKLGGWRNVNQPDDPRSFLEKLFGLNGESKINVHLHLAGSDDQPLINRQKV
jgi:phospholipid-translocating ATPase